MNLSTRVFTMRIIYPLFVWIDRLQIILENKSVVYENESAVKSQEKSNFASKQVDELK